MKGIRVKMGTGDNNVPGDEPKLLEKGGLKIMAQLINTIYDTVEWPKDFAEVTVIALKNPKATKFSDYCTTSPYRTCSKDSGEVT